MTIIQYNQSLLTCSQLQNAFGIYAHLHHSCFLQLVPNHDQVTHQGAFTETQYVDLRLSLDKYAIYVFKSLLYDSMYVCTDSHLV